MTGSVENLLLLSPFLRKGLERRWSEFGWAAGEGETDGGFSETVHGEATATASGDHGEVAHKVQGSETVQGPDAVGCPDRIPASKC